MIDLFAHNRMLDRVLSKDSAKAVSQDATITSDTLVSVAEVPLGFLGAATYDVGLISDGEDVDRFAYNAETLTRRDTMTVELAPRGGFVARIKPTGIVAPAPAPGKPTAKAAAAKPAAAASKKPKAKALPRRAP